MNLNLIVCKNNNDNTILSFNFVQIKKNNHDVNLNYSIVNLNVFYTHIFHTNAMFYMQFTLFISTNG